MDKYLILDDSNVLEAIKKLDKVSGKGLFVVNAKNELLGSITDGDIRRGFLNGISFDDDIKSIMQVNPCYVLLQTDRDQIEILARRRGVCLVPVLDNDVIIEIYVSGEKKQYNTPVVVMAGGLGTRMGDLTKNCPKPMLTVGGKPILEHIVGNFTRYGFSKFYFSVNYMAHMIKSHFLDGSLFNCSINYLIEDKRLGTVGPLRLLPQDCNGPVIVMNGDLMLDFDFSKLIDFHRAHGSKLTVCTRIYEHCVPFGVINLQDGRVVSFSEKPTCKFNINAGIYVIDSSLIQYIPQNEYYDMSTFLEAILDRNIHIHCFPLVENLVDVGRKADFDFARATYEN